MQSLFKKFRIVFHVLLAGLLMGFACLQCHLEDVSPDNAMEYWINYTDGNQDQVQLKAYSTGIGNPILLIHDLTLNHNIWNNLLTGWAPNSGRCISYDLRGHGFSTHFHEMDSYIQQYSLERHTEDIHEILRFFLLEEVTIIGLGVGGNIALNYLSKYGYEKCSQLVLLGTNFTNGLLAGQGEANYPHKTREDVLMQFYSYYSQFDSDNPNSWSSMAQLACSIKQDSIIHPDNTLQEKDLVSLEQMMNLMDTLAVLGLYDGMDELFLDMSDSQMNYPVTYYKERNFWQLEQFSQLENTQIPIFYLNNSGNVFSHAADIQYMQDLNSSFF